jgi:hypothetical protein
MYGQVYQSVMNAATKKEGFAGGTSEAGGVIAGVLAILLIVVIQLFVVRWLWNTVLVKVIAIARPLPDLWYTLGFLFLMAMIHPGYVATSA